MSRAELDDGLRIVERMLAKVEATLEPDDRDLLLSYSSDLEGAADRVHDRLDELFAGALQGFMHCAAEGLRLEAPAHVGEGFADSIDANYPGAGASFRRLAESWWTLRMLEGRIDQRNAGIVLQQLLRDVVEKIERAFLREPGEKASAEELAAEQRRLIEVSGAPIDPEEMLHASPLLVGNPLG